ncbi:MAG TPA: rRNA maturation RNase YbeY [Bacteroidia bacterium]|nr:rRNA maturation RNase YbeY [Bacteroidia bacterium]
MELEFFSEKIRFVLPQKRMLSKWLSSCAAMEKKEIGKLNYVFCSDPYLRKLNKKYLGHDYFTDIITFPLNAEEGKVLGGDIFISIARVKINAKSYGVPFSDELHRVMAHGLLHLCGYDDHTEADIKTMRKKEEKCMAARP